VVTGEMKVPTGGIIYHLISLHSRVTIFTLRSKHYTIYWKVTDLFVMYIYVVICVVVVCCSVL